MIPTLSWQTPTLSLRVPCTEHPHRTRTERVGVCHDRVGIIFLSWWWWCESVWGSSRRLRNPGYRCSPSHVYTNILGTVMYLVIHHIHPILRKLFNHGHVLICNRICWNTFFLLLSSLYWCPCHYVYIKLHQCVQCCQSIIKNNMDFWDSIAL